MDEFTPPTGPPPPKVPEGWKAIWNTQYSEWFYVNIYTKVSQWDKPTEPVYPAGEHPDPNAPPSYTGGPAQPLAAEKTGLSSNNPYASPGFAGGASWAPSQQQPYDTAEDERLARQLQAEEDARVRNQGRPISGSGAPAATSNDYYGHAPLGGGTYAAPTPGQNVDPYTGTADKGKHKSGLAGKAASLLGKLKSSGGSRPGGGYAARPAYGYGGHQQHGGYYPPHGPPMMGGGMMGGGRRPGMGAGGAMALGGLGGLAGGALLGSAMAGDDGGDHGGFGGDDGGGFGGDDGGYGGGGDFGGGDFGGGDGGGGGD